MLVIWSLFVPCTSCTFDFRSFSLVAPQRSCPIREKKLQSRDVAAVSRPQCIEPKARRKRTFGLETEATSANQVRSVIGGSFIRTNPQSCRGVSPEDSLDLRG